MRLVSLYTSTGFFSNQGIVVSTNTRGGASGSPLVNLNGEVVGLVFAANDTYSDYVKISYITDALKALTAKQQPSRKGLALMTDYYPVSDAVKFFYFPEQIADIYNKKFKNSFSKLLIVTGLLQHSELENILQIGDVIWSANDVLIGPNLYLFQKIMNETKEYSVSLEVYRQGKLLKITAPLYDIAKANNIDEMVKFGGSVFYPADDFVRLVTGVKPKSVFITKVSDGLFSELPYMYHAERKIRRIAVESIGGKKITTLHDIVDAIPNLSKKKNFIFKFYNHSLNFHNFGYTGIQNDCLDWKEIELNANYIEDAKIFKHDLSINDWTSSSITIDNHQQK